MSSRTYDIEVLAFADYGELRLPKFLQCPEFELLASRFCSFSVNPVAFICPWYDADNGAVRDGPPHTKLVERQTRLVKCLPATALIWDNAIVDGVTHDPTLWQGSLAVLVDDGRFAIGATRPQQRYYSDKDPFAQVPPGLFGNNKPVRMTFWGNRDGGTTQGRLRFRHNRNTTCNVGFADGHVGQFTGRFTSEGKAITHDALRKHFMVKWPSGIGIGPDPDLPH